MIIVVPVLGCICWCCVYGRQTLQSKKAQRGKVAAASAYDADEAAGAVAGDHEQAV